jgi:hypothetical protein
MTVYDRISTLVQKSGDTFQGLKASLYSELGELAEEIKIRDFPASNKKPGPDGVDGEIVDCIICFVAMLTFNKYLIITDKDIKEIKFKFKPKMDLYMIEVSYKKIMFKTEPKIHSVGADLISLLQYYSAAYSGFDIISHIHKKLDKWESQCAS